MDIQKFVRTPVGGYSDERLAVLAKVYAGALQSSKGYEDDRINFAYKACQYFVNMVGEADTETQEPVG
jgi:hypothetical protein